jgi:PII-like signaling protein
LTGATILSGILGYGQSQELHKIKDLAFVEKLPVVIEIADMPKN